MYLCGLDLTAWVRVNTIPIPCNCTFTPIAGVRVLSMAPHSSANHGCNQYCAVDGQHERCLSVAVDGAERSGDCEEHRTRPRPACMPSCNVRCCKNCMGKLCLWWCCNSRFHQRWRCRLTVCIARKHRKCGECDRGHSHTAAKRHACDGTRPNSAKSVSQSVSQCILGSRPLPPGGKCFTFTGGGISRGSG
jgi:hypothetical protein